MIAAESYLTGWPHPAGTIVLILYTIGALLGLFSHIYFIVRAFKTSVIWGIVVFLLPGLGTLLFTVFNFDRAKAPLRWLLLSLTLLIGSVVAAFFMQPT